MCLRVLFYGTYNNYDLLRQVSRFIFVRVRVHVVSYIAERSNTGFTGGGMPRHKTRKTPPLRRGILASLAHLVLCVTVPIRYVYAPTQYIGGHWVKRADTFCERFLLICLKIRIES